METSKESIVGRALGVVVRTGTLALGVMCVGANAGDLTISAEFQLAPGQFKFACDQPVIGGCPTKPAPEADSERKKEAGSLAGAEPSDTAASPRRNEGSPYTNFRYLPNCAVSIHCGSNILRPEDLCVRNGRTSQGAVRETEGNLVCASRVRVNPTSY